MAKVVSARKVRVGDVVTIIEADVSVTGTVSGAEEYNGNAEIYLGEDMAYYFEANSHKSDGGDTLVIRHFKAPKPEKVKKGKKK